MPSPGPNGVASAAPVTHGADAVAQIRTLALVGAASAGKTCLAEALLHRAGMITTPGALERGGTVSDFDPLEKRMQHSLNSAVMHLNHGGVRVHLIDTPGAPDFVGQSLPALEAVETAAIVVNAVNGIEPMAQRMMDYAAERHLDRLIVVNKIDAAPAVLADLLADLLTRSSLIALMYQSSHSAGHSQAEHVAIVDALEKRDARAAVRLLEAHLGNVERNLQLSPRTADLAAVLQPI